MLHYTWGLCKIYFLNKAYNGMTFEKFILAVIRSELLYPKRLVFRADNLYAKLLENSLKGREKDE